MRKLNIYLQLSFIKYFFITFVGLSLVVYIGQLLGQIDKKEPLGSILLYSLYIIPYFVQLTLPIILFLSTMIMLNRLDSSNELDIIKTNGLSLWRIIFYLTPIVLIMGLSVTFFLSPLVSITQKIRTEDSNNINLSTFNSKNFWIADEVDYKKIIIRAESAKINNDIILLSKPTVFEIEGGDLNQTIDGSHATIYNQILTIFDASIKNHGKYLPYHINKYLIKSNISIANLQNIILSPNMLSFWQLPKFIHNIESLGLISFQYQLYFYELIFYPFTLLAMFILSFALSIKKNKRTKHQTLIALGAAFLIFLAGNIINVLGSAGITNPLLSVIAQLTLILTIALYTMARKEGL